MTLKKHAKTGRIRGLLRDIGKGMSAQEIADHIGLDADYVRVMLGQMPDTYIERWDRTKTGRGWLAVWNVAHVPPDAMRPKSAAVERRLYDAQYRERKRYAKRKAEMAAKLEAEAKTAALKEEQERIKTEECTEAAPKKSTKKTPSMQPAAPAGYQPMKTVWVTPPPWSH